MGWRRSKGRQLLSVKNTFHSIALGVAVGMFFGLAPLWGLKTLLAPGVASLLGANLVAAAGAVTLHDVVLPLWPLLLCGQYDLGYWLLSHPHEWPPSLRWPHASPAVGFRWSEFFTVGWPLLVGASVMAVPVAAATYFLVLALIDRAKRKRAGAHAG